MLKFRDLDKVRFLMQESSGLDVGYAYDDLVFSEHGIFILRFNDEDDNTMYCYFNKDLLNAKQKEIQHNLVDVGSLNGVKILYKGKFEMEQKPENELEFELRLYEV